MNPHLHPWSISPDAFPEEGFASDQLDFLLGYAILAPSTHNSQPWLFRVNAMDVELFADRHRALPVVDPQDRELVISCGSALMNLRIAAEYFGHRYRVEPFPDPANADLLARFHIGLEGETTSEDVLLFHALTQRHTNRRPFRPEPLPGDLAADLVALVQQEQCELHLISGEAVRAAMADLIAEADQRQWADRGFREELARWVQTKPDHSADGLPLKVLGVKQWLGFAALLMIRSFDRGDGQAARDRDIMAHSPTLAALSTASDDPPAWLQAGQALQGLLLRARVDDVWASFLNQPIEVPDLRPRVSELLGCSGHPQILLRLGYGDAASPTPRRSVKSVRLQQRPGHAAS